MIKAIVFDQQSYLTEQLDIISELKKNMFSSSSVYSCHNICEMNGEIEKFYEDVNIINKNVLLFC